MEPATSESVGGVARGRGRSAAARSRKRPFVLYMIIALLVLNAISLVAEGLIYYYGFPDPGEVFLGRPLHAIGGDRLVVAPLVVGAVAYLIAAIGLWRLKQWAWVGTMLILGIGLAVDIAAYFRGHPSFISMVLRIPAVFYLNDRDVQHLFGRHRAGGGGE